jgi:hypothetical protein
MKFTWRALFKCAFLIGELSVAMEQPATFLVASGLGSKKNGDYT